MSTQCISSPSCSSTSINNDDMNQNNQKSINRLKYDLYKIAEKELRETEHVRNECLKQLKIWIEQNEDIQNCLLDDNFLLRFLRVKKFSIPMAQQILLKYLNYRKRFKQIFYELDYSEMRVNELISNGYIYVSPVRDEHGRRVIIYDLNKFDPKIYTGIDMARAHAITYETLLTDEINQIVGVTHIADIGGVNPSFISLFSVTEFATLIRWGEQSFPMRHKEIHLINMPQALKYVYDFAKSNMSQKLKDRCLNHDTIISLTSTIDKRSIPIELGGDTLKSKEMIKWWQNELDIKRKKLLSLDDMILLSDRGIITSRSIIKNGLEQLNGSFRKLEVD